MSMFYMGCAMWGFPKWGGSIFPRGTTGTTCLKYYAKNFSCVEGNTTFYAVPSEHLLQEWALNTDEEFRFLLKIPKAYSHEGELWPQYVKMLSFVEHCNNHLRSKLGPLLLQLPPSYTAAYGEDLASLLNAWRAGSDHPIAVEFRHGSWFHPPYRERVDLMLKRMKLSRVILDTRAVYESEPMHPCKKPYLPVHFEPTADIAFIRYISHPVSEQNKRYMEEWADRIKDYLSQGKTVYFFVHCPQEEHTPDLVRYFDRVLRRKEIDIPPARWETAPAFPKQQRLF